MIKNTTDLLRAMKSRIKWLLLGIGIIWITHTLLDTQQSKHGNWHKQSWQSLYTKINLTIEGDTVDVAKAIRQLDVFFESFTLQFQTGSRLDSTFRASKQGDTVMVDSLAWELLQFAENSYKESQGVIHPGVGSLLRAWGLEWGLTPAVPNDSILEQEKNKLKKLFYQTLPNQKSVLILQDSGTIALGAFSKGFAMDVAKEKLSALKLDNYLLEIGGDLLYSGKNPRGKDWLIAITDPDQKNGQLFALHLPPEFNAMATSGGYERFFQDSTGAKHHHILNPVTAKSSTGTKSTTVFAKTAAEADMLATWLFVEGTELAKQWETAKKVATVVVPEEGDLYLSPSLLPRKVDLETKK